MFSLARIKFALLAVVLTGAVSGAGWLAMDAGVAARSTPQAMPQPLMTAIPVIQPIPVQTAPARPAPLPVPVPPAVADVLDAGVLIVISKASQRMYVFKDGALWDTSPVSTGRRGHSTPAGIFPILQKKTFHRSNLYSNAPMPFMQRLTWSGIAIHSGYLPGYPASHGCIRLPPAFARALYGLTRAGSTTVVIANEPIKSDAFAQSLALAADRDHAAAEALAAVPAPAVLPVASPPESRALPPAGPGGQTIQLAAATSPAEAEAQWARLLDARPELAGFRKAVIPAMVGTRQYYRLRVSAPGAHAYCSSLKRAGIPCFRVS